MASHFVSLNRGVDGGQYSDFVTGTASSGGSIEVRIDDAAGFRQAEIDVALENFRRRFFANVAQWQPAGFVING